MSNKVEKKKRDNLGKRFEIRFLKDFSKIENISIDRLKDPMGMYRNVKNICDFIAYKYPYIYYIETKSKKGNTYPLSSLTQYDDLIEKKGIKGIAKVVIIWFRDHDKVVAIPIEEIERLKELDYKSINVKMIGKEEYNIIEIPIQMKRDLPYGDYNIIIENKKLF